MVSFQKSNRSLSHIAIILTTFNLKLHKQSVDASSYTVEALCHALLYTKLLAIDYLNKLHK